MKEGGLTAQQLESRVLACQQLQMNNAQAKALEKVSSYTKQNNLTMQATSKSVESSTSKPTINITEHRDRNNTGLISATTMTNHSELIKATPEGQADPPTKPITNLNEDGSNINTTNSKDNGLPPTRQSEHLKLLSLSATNKIGSNQK